MSLDKTAAACRCMPGTETRRTNERRRARDPQRPTPGLNVCWFTADLRPARPWAFGHAYAAPVTTPRSEAATPVLGGAYSPATIAAITARRINTIIATWQR